jgi:hypothetical protein
MIQRYKFRDLQQVFGARGELEVSLNDLYPKSKPDADGKVVPAVIEPVQIDRGDPAWQEMVPKEVAKIIQSRKLFNHQAKPYQLKSTLNQGGKHA